MLALPGSAYLYQGEELGLLEVADLPPDALHDPVWERTGHTLKGRDGARVPLPWNRSGSSYGFGDDGSWLPQPHWFAESLSRCPRRKARKHTGDVPGALALRRKLQTQDSSCRSSITTPTTSCISDDPTAGGASPTSASQDQPLPTGEIVLSSGSFDHGDVLPPKTTVWLLEPSQIPN